MKTSVVINGMPTVIKAFVEARIRIQNDLDELETYTGKKTQDAVQQRTSTGLCSAMGVITLGWASLQNISPECSR